MTPRRPFPSRRPFPLRRRRRGDAGGIAIEAAIVVPGVVGLVLVAVAAGRVQTASGTVEAAARSTARTVSMARSVDGMDELARTTARTTLRQQGVSCRNLEVAVSLGELTTPAGPVGTVRVGISCEVDLDGLLLGTNGATLPWTRTVVGEFVSVIDRYRGT